MPLANKQWRPISVHEMVLEFLRSERHRFPSEVVSRIDTPNLNDGNENFDRLRMLYVIRAPFIAEIPPDTQWFEVTDLTDQDLPQLLVVARCGWDDDANDANELLKVGRRRPQELAKPFTSWAKLILWGHTKTGPFTIFEGNNRLTAYVSSALNSGLRVPVIIGLSPTPCFWHKPDPARFICQDLWRQG